MLPGGHRRPRLVRICYLCICIKGDAIVDLDGNFLLLRLYHGEHGPEVPVMPEDIVLQRVLRKRKCMSILTKMSIPG
jgi:hypothetical protein